MQVAMDIGNWLAGFAVIHWMHDHAGTGWTVAVIVFALGLLTGWKFWSYHATSVTFFEDQHALNKAKGSLSAELEKATGVYAAWPAGGSARNISDEALKHISRLVLRRPDVADADLQEYVTMFDANNIENVRSTVNTLTARAIKAGVDVRWHRDPCVSAIINRDPKDRWARIELLLPHVESTRRPSVLIKARRHGALLQTVDDMYERLWGDSGSMQ